MRNIKQILIIILLLIIAVGVVYDIVFNKPDHILDPNVQWKTDTIYVDKPYEVPVPYGVPSKPRYITIYEVDSSLIDSLQIIIDDKDFTITGLEQEILISKNFLKLYPNNPKLIDLELLFDTLSITMLNVSGVVSKLDYPIFIEHYKYRWSNGEFTKEKNIRYVPQQKQYLDYKLGGGYDLLYLTPYLQGEISKGFSKFELYGRVGIGLLNNKSSEIKIGANYNLGKNGK